MERELRKYQSKPVHVTGFQWWPEIGEGYGVRNRPKKHPANPDDFYVRDRFGNEKQIKPGQFCIQRPDGSHEIVPNGAMQDIYDDIEAIGVSPEAQESPAPAAVADDPPPAPEQPAEPKPKRKRVRRKASDAD